MFVVWSHSNKIARDRVFGLKKIIEKKIFAHCPDAECEFHSKLPTYTCDEDLYREKPSFLITTIDKFALLSWNHLLGIFWYR